MRSLLVGALLLAPALAEDLRAVTLPVAGKGEVDKADPTIVRAIVTLDPQGRIWWGKKQVSLDELSAELRVRKANAGVEKVPGGPAVSKLFVLLRADKDAPWQHVQWILTTLAQQRIYRIHFGVKRFADRSYTPAEAQALGARLKDVAPPATPVLEAKLQSFLPIDRGIVPQPKNPAQVIKAGVHVIARKETPRAFGPQGWKKTYNMPVEFKYRFGDKESLQHAAVAKWLKDANRAARAAQNAVLKGEIRAGFKVPFKYVVAVLNQMRAAGLQDVDLYGTVIPGPGLRKLKVLPYPKANYPR